MNKNGSIYHPRQSARRNCTNPAPLLSVFANGSECRAGARVRVAPKSKPGTGKHALFGKVGVVASIERDRSGKIYVALQAEQKPGMYQGALRRVDQQFLYRIDEVEPFVEDCA